MGDVLGRIGVELPLSDRADRGPHHPGFTRVPQNDREVPVIDMSQDVGGPVGLFAFS